MRKLRGSVWEYLPLTRGRKRPTREEALKAIPVRMTR